jgi:hypothetical protein
MATTKPLSSRLLLTTAGWLATFIFNFAILLRSGHPSDQPQEFTAKLAALLELPAASAQQFTARSPWSGEASMTIDAAAPHTFHLHPFEMLTLALSPK